MRHLPTFKLEWVGLKAPWVTCSASMYAQLFPIKSHRFLAQDGPATNADRQRFSFIKCPTNLPPQNGPGNRAAASLLQTGSLCPFWCVLFSSLEAFLKLYYRESCLSSIGATSSPAAPWRKCRPSKGPFFSVPWYIAAFVMIRLCRSCE